VRRKIESREKMTTKSSDSSCYFDDVVPPSPSSVVSSSWRSRKRRETMKLMERFSLSSREKKVESMVKSNKKSEKGLVVIKTPGDFLFNQCLSLGSGIFSSTGNISFIPSPAGSIRSSNVSLSSTTSDEDIDFYTKPQNSQNEIYSKRILPTSPNSPTLSPTSPTLPTSPTFPTSNRTSTSIQSPIFSFNRNSSCFMRTSDLGVVESLGTNKNNKALTEVNLVAKDHQEAHYHYPSVRTPPGVDDDSNENWVALDAGKSYSPIAPFVIESLIKTGLSRLTNSSMWVPEKRVKQILQKCQMPYHGWKVNGPVSFDQIDQDSWEKDVLVWTGSFPKGTYGSERPCIRSEGLLNISPEGMFDLLLDNSRVNSYNKTSLGREDIVVLQDDLKNEGPFGRSVTKIVKSSNRPPLIRKILQFITLLHGKKLECGSGYLLVSRAVSRGNEACLTLDSSILRSEIAMGVTLILRIKEDPNKCIMITVNHLVSQIPSFLARTVGMSASVNFLNDIRSICN